MVLVNCLCRQPSWSLLSGEGAWVVSSQDDPPNVALLMMVTSGGGTRLKHIMVGASPVKSDLYK